MIIVTYTYGDKESFYRAKELVHKFVSSKGTPKPSYSSVLAGGTTGGVTHLTTLVGEEKYDEDNTPWNIQLPAISPPPIIPVGFGCLVAIDKGKHSKDKEGEHPLPDEAFKLMQPFKTPPIYLELGKEVKDVDDCQEIYKWIFAVYCKLNPKTDLGEISVSELLGMAVLDQRSNHRGTCQIQ